MQVTVRCVYMYIYRYLINRTASPALSLFAPTNILQPVVRRCRFGCPTKRKKKENTINFQGNAPHTGLLSINCKLSS